MVLHPVLLPEQEIYSHERERYGCRPRHGSLEYRKGTLGWQFRQSVYQSLEFVLGLGFRDQTDKDRDEYVGRQRPDRTIEVLRHVFRRRGKSYVPQCTGVQLDPEPQREGHEHPNKETPEASCGSCSFPEHAENYSPKHRNDKKDKDGLGVDDDARKSHDQVG